MEVIHSKNAGDGDDLTADVDIDFAGGVEKECSTRKVAACLTVAPVD